MQDNVKACPKCDTINEIDAKYCRFCRNEFTEEEIINQQPQLENQPQQHLENQQGEAQVVHENEGEQLAQKTVENEVKQEKFQYTQNNNVSEQTICGIPTSEVSIFLGSGAKTYLPKFMRKSVTSSKAGFNIVVFILGFFLTLVGVSFWFLHKKLYKIGIPVLITGLILCIVLFSSFFNMVDVIFESGFYDDIVQDSYQYGESYEYEFYVNSDNIPKELIKSTILFLMISMLCFIVTLITTVVLAVFADYWYMNNTVSKIYKVKALHSDNLEYQLMKAGGTNPLAWIIPLVFYIVLNIAMFIAFIQLIIEHAYVRF